MLPLRRHRCGAGRHDEWPNIDLLREVAERTDAKVTASGGISKLDDLRDIKILSDFGVDSAILGKSLYARAFTLKEAVRSRPLTDTAVDRGRPRYPSPSCWADQRPLLTSSRRFSSSRGARPS